jgi:hypothetical protein
MTAVSMPSRAGASLRARLVPFAAVLALAAFAAAPGFACTTCDTNNKCHSGDEQGGYLCRVSEVHCGFLSQLFGAECQQKTCETTVPCDNRKPAPGAPPRSEADIQGGSCAGAPPAARPPSPSAAGTE